MNEKEFTSSDFSEVDLPFVFSEVDLPFAFSKGDLKKVQDSEPNDRSDSVLLANEKAAEMIVDGLAKASAHEVRRKDLAPKNIAILRDGTARLAESVMSNKFSWIVGMMVASGGNIGATAMMFGVAASIHALNKAKTNGTGPKAVSKSIKLDKAYVSMLESLGVNEDKINIMSKEFSNLYDSKVKEQMYDKLVSLYQVDTLSKINEHIKSVKELGVTAADYETELTLARKEYSESLFLEKAHGDDFRKMYEYLLVEGGGYEQSKVDEMMSLYDEESFINRKQMFIDEENFQKSNSLFCEHNRKARMEESFMAIVKSNFDQPTSCAEQLILQAASGSCRYDGNRPAEFDFNHLSDETQASAQMAAYLRRKAVMINTVQNGCSKDDIAAFPALVRLGGITDTERALSEEALLATYDAKELHFQKEDAKRLAASMIPKNVYGFSEFYLRKEKQKTNHTTLRTLDKADRQAEESIKAVEVDKKVIEDKSPMSPTYDNVIPLIKENERDDLSL